MAVRTPTRRVDHIAMTQILEEARQTQRIHATGDDRGGWLHAQPFLMVVGTIGRVALYHVGDVAVIRAAFHLAEAHGAHVDTGSALQT